MVREADEITRAVFLVVTIRAYRFTLLCYVDTRSATASAGSARVESNSGLVKTRPNHAHIFEYTRGTKYESKFIVNIKIVLTVEPGVYISPDASVEERWRGIGVRIEDNVIVTLDSYCNITANIPKAASELERIVRDR
jgi:hypothetical protein